SLTNDEVPLHVDVSARQFEWRMRYPSPATWRAWKKTWKEKTELPDKTAPMETWAKKPQFDDIHMVNELHIINDRLVQVHLSTKDVIHSFNSAHMRVKQDALPGKVIPVWFKPIDYNVEPTDKKDGKATRWEYRGGMDPDTGKVKVTTMIWEIACA